MKKHSDEQFLYLTTTGRKTGRPREIEIWFVEREGRFYILAEHGLQAHCVQNLAANSLITARISGKRWKATGRILKSEMDPKLDAEVRALAREKYGWGEGLPVELRLHSELQD